VKQIPQNPVTFEALKEYKTITINSRITLVRFNLMLTAEECEISHAAVPSGVSRPTINNQKL